MGLAGIASSMGAAGRSESENIIMKNESKKRISSESKLSSARGQELDSLARESSESNRTVVDKAFQLQAAEEAVKAARSGFIASLANIATSVLSTKGGGGSWGSAAVGSLGNVFSSLGAYFAMHGAKQEQELLSLQFGKLSQEADIDQKNTNALFANGL